MELVIIANESLKIEELANPLTKMGFTIQKIKDYKDLDLKVSKPELIIYFCTKDEGLKFNTIALKEGLKWIPISISYSLARIGPLFIPNETACYKCLDLRMSAASIPALKETGKILDLAFSLACKMLAIEVLKLYSKSSPSLKSNLINQLFDVNLLNLSGELSKIYYVPTCPECGVKNNFNPELQFIREKSLVSGEYL